MTATTSSASEETLVPRWILEGDELVLTYWRSEGPLEDAADAALTAAVELGAAPESHEGPMAIVVPEQTITPTMLAQADAPVAAPGFPEIIGTSPGVNENNVSLNPDPSGVAQWPTVDVLFDDEVDAPWRSIFAYSSSQGARLPTITVDPTRTVASLDLGDWRTEYAEQPHAGEVFTALVRDSVTGHVTGNPVEPMSWQFTMGVDADSPGEFPQGLDITADAYASQQGATVDADGDGDLDLVVATGGNGTWLYRNAGNGRFTAWDVIGDLATTGAMVATGDINADGWVDLVSGLSPGRNYVFLHTGDPTDPYGAGTAIGLVAVDEHDTTAIELADMNNDGWLDLVEANGSGERNYLYFFDDALGEFQSGVSLGMETEDSEDLAIGDIDNNGWLDIVVANYALATPNQIYYNDPLNLPNLWPAVPLSADALETKAILLADLNNDGWLDAVAGNEGLGGSVNRVYQNNTTGGFIGGLDLGSAADSTHALASADVDGDGYLDLIVGNFEETNRLYMNQGNPAAIIFDAGAAMTGDIYRTRDLVAADIDNDNDVDIVAIDQNAADHRYLNTLRPEVTSSSATPTTIVDADTGYNKFSMTFEFDQAMDTTLTPTVVFSDAVEGPGATLINMSRTWTDNQTIVISYSVVDAQQRVDDIDVTLSDLTSEQGIDMSPVVFADAFSIHMQNPFVASVTPTTDTSGGAEVRTINLDVLASATEYYVTIEFNEAMDVGVDPTISLDAAGDPSNTLTPLAGYWTDARNYVYEYALKPTSQQSLSNIGVTVESARNADGNPQIDSTTASVFDIDTIRPQAESINVAPTVVSRLDVGANNFAVSVRYSKTMDTDPAVAPAFTFDAGGEDLSGTLTFSHGSWSGDALQYTAYYDVTNDNKLVYNVRPLVSGGQDTGGNAPDPAQPPSVQLFDVDMAAPEVNDVAPTIEWIGTTTTSFILDITFNKKMSQGPTSVNFSANVSPYISYDLANSSWQDDTTKLVWRAVIDVVGVPPASIAPADILCGISGGRDIYGNTQTSFAGQPGFGVDVDRPTVTVATPSLGTVTSNEQGGQFTLTFDYDDTMDPTSAPSVTFSQQVDVDQILTFVSGAWNDPIAPTSYTLTYNISTTELDLGPINVVADGARDKSDNPQETFNSVGLFNIDTLRPRVDGLLVSPAWLGVGEVGDKALSITITYDKEMDWTVAPTIVFSTDVSATLQFDNGAWQPGNQTYVAQYDVTNAGEYLPDIDITVSDARDVDGNIQPSLTVPDTLTIEMRGAVVTQVEPATPSGPFNSWANRSRIGTWYPLAIHYDKQMEATPTPTVTLSPNVAPLMTFDAGMSQWSADGTIFYAYFTVADGGVEIEPGDITVDVFGAEDARVGPQEPFSGSNIFGYDMIAPTVLAGGITTNAPTVARDLIGSHFEVTIEYSEIMATAPEPAVTFTGSPDPTPVLQFDAGTSGWEPGDTSYIARYTVQDIEMLGGPYGTGANNAVDRAGNVQTAAFEPALFDIDTQRPLLTSVIATPSVITENTTGDDAFQLQIDFNEDMNAAVMPTIDFGALDPQVLATLTFDAAASSWIDSDTFIAVYDVDDLNAQLANIPVRVRDAQDVHGNVMNTQTQADVFEIDIRSLFVTGVDVSSNLIAQPDFGSTFIAAIHYNQPMDPLSAPSLVMTPDVSDVLSPQAGGASWVDASTYEIRYDVLPTVGRKAMVAFDVTGGIDLRGDTPLPYHVDDIVEIDTASPAPTSVIGTPNPVAYDRIGDIFQLTLQFDRAMDLSAIPTITFPNENPSYVLTPTGGSWINAQSYAARYHIEDEVAILADIDVQVADCRSAIGNVQDTPEVFPDVFSIDTARPTITSFVLSDDFITEDDVDDLVTMTVYFDKEMDASIDPTIRFSNASINNALLLESGTWQGATPQTYVAQFRVVRAWVEAENAAIYVEGAEDSAGNPQTPSTYAAPIPITVSMRPLLITDIAVSDQLVNRPMLGETFTVTATYLKDADTSIIPTVTITPASAASVFQANATVWLDARTLQSTFTIRADAPEVEAWAGVSIDGAFTPDGRPQVPGVFTDLFHVDTQTPSADSVSPAPVLVNTQYVGDNRFSLTFEFSEDMDRTVTPVVDFPSETPSPIIRQSSAQWLDDRRFRVRYDVSEYRTALADVDVRIDGGVDADGNTMSGPSVFTDVFDIEMLRPRVADVVLSDEAITNAMVGPDAFTIRVTYDKAMQTTSPPVAEFGSPAADSVLQLSGASGWINATTYEFHYDVLDVPADADDVTIRITDGVGTQGNTQEAYDAPQTLNIKISAHPEVAFTSPEYVQFDVGAPGVFTLSIGFNTAMDTTIAPTVHLRPETPVPLTVTASGWNPADPTLYEITYSMPARITPGVVHVPFDVTDARDDSGTLMTPYEEGRFTILVAEDLGAVDFLRLDDVVTSNGTLAYQLETMHDALLTLELEDGGSRNDVTMLDQNFQPIDASTLGRTDHRAGAGQAYYLLIETDRYELDMAIANLVDERTADVYVHDTADDDAFVFSASRTGYGIGINGVDYSLDLRDLTSVTFDGTLGGDDTADVTGSASQETATFHPLRLDVASPAFTAHITNSPDIAYHGGGGDDRALFYDSGLVTDQDDFTAGPQNASMEGPGYLNRADDIYSADGYATAGSNDRAKLLDSRYDDQLTADATTATMSGHEFINRIENFAFLAAYGTAGGDDSATIADTTGDDSLIATPQQLLFTAVNTNQRFRGFESVTIESSGGEDTAILYDSHGDDTFEAGATQARMYNATTDITVRGFRSVEARATGGGVDRAILHDSAGRDDRFTWSTDMAVLEDVAGTQTTLTARYFDTVLATASGDAGDTASFTTPLGVNQLLASGDWLSLTSRLWESQRERLRIDGFESVTADGDSSAENHRTVGAIDYALTFTGDWES